MAQDINEVITENRTESTRDADGMIVDEKKQKTRDEDKGRDINEG